jgi:hypothetical protein
VIAVASEAFVGLANQMATELSIPDARIAVVPHPIGGTPEASLLERADAAIDELIRLLS